MLFISRSIIEVTGIGNKLGKKKISISLHEIIRYNLKRKIVGLNSLPLEIYKTKIKTEESQADNNEKELKVKNFCCLCR
jgi:hypothetical protein